MPNWMIEFLSVLALSKKTQWAIILGIVFFIGINFLGQYMLSNIELNGVTKGVQNVVLHKLANKYDKAAWFVLISFFVLAYKFYQKDKKRFW